MNTTDSQKPKFTCSEIINLHQNLKPEGQYFVGPCPNCGGTDRFTVHKETGQFNCRNCKPGGKTIESRRAFQAIIEKFVAPTTQSMPSSPSNQNHDLIPNSGKPTAQERAQRLFNLGQPINGTYAQQWLAKQRAITVGSTKLRYHPAIYQKDLHGHYPCLLVQFDHCETGKLTAVQRIFFTLKEKKFQKRFTGSPKNGGALLMGNLNSKTIIVTEGVEDALSIMHVVNNVAVWATGGEHNLRCFTIPRKTTAILIAADPNQAGIEAAQHLAHRAHAMKLKVRITHPLTHQGDWNDLLVSGHINAIKQYIYQWSSKNRIAAEPDSVANNR